MSNEDINNNINKIRSILARDGIERDKIHLEEVEKIVIELNNDGYGYDEQLAAARAIANGEDFGTTIREIESKADKIEQSNSDNKKTKLSQAKNKISTFITNKANENDSEISNAISLHYNIMKFRNKLCSQLDSNDNGKKIYLPILMYYISFNYIYNKLLCYNSNKKIKSNENEIEKLIDQIIKEFISSDYDNISSNINYLENKSVELLNRLHDTITTLNEVTMRSGNTKITPENWNYVINKITANNRYIITYEVYKLCYKSKDNENDTIRIRYNNLLKLIVKSIMKYDFLMTNIYNINKSSEPITEKRIQTGGEVTSIETLINNIYNKLTDITRIKLEHFGILCKTYFQNIDNYFDYALYYNKKNIVNNKLTDFEGVSELLSNKNYSTKSYDKSNLDNNKLQLFHKEIIKINATLAREDARTIEENKKDTIAYNSFSINNITNFNDITKFNNILSQLSSKIYTSSNMIYIVSAINITHNLKKKLYEDIENKNILDLNDIHDAYNNLKFEDDDYDTKNINSFILNNIKIIENKPNFGEFDVQAVYYILFLININYTLEEKINESIHIDSQDKKNNKTKFDTITELIKNSYNDLHDKDDTTKMTAIIYRIIEYFNNTHTLEKLIVKKYVSHDYFLSIINNYYNSVHHTFIDILLFIKCFDIKHEDIFDLYKNNIMILYKKINDIFVTVSDNPDPQIRGSLNNIYTYKKNLNDGDKTKLTDLLNQILNENDKKEPFYYNITNNNIDSYQEYCEKKYQDFYSKVKLY
tara:strand:+ start:27 stop:2318 length:2292 start_codon:yes stop_codon:yes gene_type:complete